MIQSFITGVKIAAVAAVVSVVIYFYYEYNSVKGELVSTQQNLKVSEENNSKLKQLAEDNIKTIEKLQVDSRFIRTVNQELIDANDKKRETIKELEEKFKDAKLDKAAEKKPQVVQKLMNVSTHKMKLCLEKESGAKGAEYEIDCK